MIFVRSGRPDWLNGLWNLNHKRGVHSPSFAGLQLVSLKRIRQGTDQPQFLRLRREGAESAR
jgi:hypothetical protein